MFEAQVTTAVREAGSSEFIVSNTKGRKASDRVVLAINWEADCAPWWDQWWGTARGTRSGLPRELRYLDSKDQSEPMDIDRLGRVLAWCEARDGWREDIGQALVVKPIIDCDCCENGVADSRDFAYTPGYAGPRLMPCIECDGRGWSLVVDDD